MRFKRIVRLSLIAVTAAGCAAVILRADDVSQSPPAIMPTTEPSAVHISPDAHIMLDGIRDAYAKLQGLDLAGNISIAFDGGGQTKDDHVPFTASFRAPNQFIHQIKDEDTIISTGQKLYTYFVRKNEYISDDSTKQKGDQLPGPVNAMLMDQNPSLLLALSNDASGVITSSATDVSVGKPVQLDDGSYPALQIATDDHDTRVLIDGKTNLIRQVQHDLLRKMKKQGVPNATTALITIDYKMTKAAAPSAAQYDWTPPANAKPMKLDAPGAEEFPAIKLEGKPAPTFTLNNLDGKPVSLADQKPNVVVLDFWATWCGPCRAGLPHVAKVAADRAGKGVQVFAVNLQEDAAQVKSFLAEQKLNIPVLLDTDGKVAEKYLAESIPELVVIGKDGVVQKVIYTSPEEEEKTLNDQIDIALKAK